MAMLVNNTTTGQYLAVISERQMLGTIQGHNVYRVAKVAIMPYHLNTNAILNEQQRKDESTYLRVVDSLLNDRVCETSSSNPSSNPSSSTLHI
jgi:hypothetical protein